MNIEQKIQDADDRLAIRSLVDGYAFCADTRDAKGQMALFTQDTRFEVYYDPDIGSAFSGHQRQGWPGSCLRRPEQIQSDHALQRSKQRHIEWR